MSRRPPVLLALAAALALAGSLAGCGLGQGPDPGPTSLRVTRDLGTQGVVDTTRPRTRADETALDLARANAPQVPAAPRGSLFVNGLRAGPGTRVTEGDRVWLDLHDEAAPAIPAVVGSFPTPFVRAAGDKVLPIRVECTIPGAPYCRAARQRFADVGLTVASGGLQGSQLEETTRVLVGTFDQLSVDDTAALLEGGPRLSGVYAQLDPDRRTVETLDPEGRPVRTLGAGTGVVAAVRQEANQVVWVITGTDERGLDAAIDAVGERTLAGHLAAVATDGRVIGVPEPAR